ncbi:MAG: insulinase family protein [Bacteroidetes bacterium]|nr:insulinase family protein [Bacteroidota bacterium]MBU1581013.1 insulinase family protein [Bacteroidota bacterium]MBU2465561.1 insulinase family protein [Bacteroidota bacterium]MBU2557557.1 insulinase family protein [Bacteroidota bacterium]
MITDSYNYRRLPNGIRLIHRQKAGQIAHLALMVNTGSRDEQAHEFGLAHLIEHMIFKGTKKRKAYHVLSRLENVGGELNAYTTKEETCIHASFLNIYAERSMELLADIAFQASFPASELEKEKEVVLDEINAYRDNPSEEIFDEFEDQLFDGHPIGHPILGTEQAVKSFSRNALFRFVKRNYATDQMVLALVGDIPFDKFWQIAEKYFGNTLAKGHAPKLDSVINPTIQHIQKEKNSYLSHCILGNKSYNRQHPNKHGMVLLNNILGGPGLNSRLNLNIREKYGFAYNIESHYTAYSDTGIFLVYLGIDPRSAEKAMQLVYKELYKLKNQQLGSLQLHRAQQQLIGQLAIGFESGLSETLSIARSHLLFDNVDNMNQIIQKILKTDASKLMEVAQEIFDFDNFNTLIYKGTQKDFASN